MPRHPVVGRDQAVTDLRERLIRGERSAITAPARPELPV